jgi:hypothetical protein
MWQTERELLNVVAASASSAVGFGAGIAPSHKVRYFSLASYYLNYHLTCCPSVLIILVSFIQHHSGSPLVWVYQGAGWGWGS